jgi:diguanylate cyclase (GGDEF)-like protein
MRSPQRSPVPLFALSALASLVAVLVLGAVLARSLRSEADRRGLSQARAEAELVAETAVEPLLSATSLDHLTATQRRDLSTLAVHSVEQGTVLRLRIRDLRARVVVSNDGSGFGGPPDDEALDAAHGVTRALLTSLNSDSNDHGAANVAAVEIYLPLIAGTPTRRVGVLETYVPYAPIAHDVAKGLRHLYVVLGAGLLGLYLLLFAISLMVTRGLRRESKRNAFLAGHDALTELPNRSLFQRRAAAAVDAARRGSGTVALAVVDLDRFKDVNDALGHPSGDALLTEIARRLTAHVRPGDTVARLGGDEYGLIVRDAADPEVVLSRLLDVIDREVELSGLPISVQASLGYATAPADGTDVEELLQRADVAMYAAKAHHTGVLRYDPSLDRYDAETLALVGQLRKGIAENQLVLHYQPQVSPADGRVLAVEALVRWQHPEHGLLFPDRFLPLAEQTDVIDSLTRWVMNRAAADLVQLGWSDVRTAVNVSARTVTRADFATEVLEILAEHELAAERLVVEVTETTFLSDPERAAEVLGALSAAGVSISLDDFGQGQTSLGYLPTLPLEEVKIDRAFVMDMLVNDAHAAIVRSVVDLGHNLGLRVVAEGIETEETLAALRDLGCDVAQGYLVARPMALDALEGWLEVTEPESSPA